MSHIQQQSQLPVRIRKEWPQDETAKNARLLIRAGYINKRMAGAYEFLPFGLRSLKRIMEIIREEMNAVGGHEVLMSSLQSPDIWKQSGRWSGDTDEVWFRTKLRVGDELGLGWTHEEPTTDAMRHHIHSYKDMPAYLYQFQTKFRNEERAKSGILRTREFIMKDLYSFCADEAQHKEFYEKCAEAYMNVFTRVGIGDRTYRTFASGGAFSEFSDEFQAVCDAGEDTIYVHKERNMALNKEVYTDEVLKKLSLKKEELEEMSASEVGNIFTLGTRFSEALGLMYTDSNGVNQPVFMGSYGIGPARLLGVIVEIFGTESSLSLPRSVAPYDAHIVVLDNDEQTQKTVETLCEMCRAKGREVLVDDRDMSVGEKFTDADLIGIPDRVVVSRRSIEQGGVEYKDMQTGEVVYVSAEGFLTAHNERI